MAGTYDISTVVSRSYISEQVQDNMQKGAENKSAFFMSEFQKESEKNRRSVQKAEKSENPTITQNAVKRQDQKEKKRRNGNKSSDGKSSKIDFTA
ncbi:MAG: hypothetical protein IJD28_01175 [Deferribacterales bacterium]|nr:hypothetical protein [Deferribacterales bacterium]